MNFIKNFKKWGQNDYSTVVDNKFAEMDIFGGIWKKHLYKLHIFQCMGRIFCVEIQREPLEFHTKYLTLTLEDTILYKVKILRALRFTSS